MNAAGRRKCIQIPTGNGVMRPSVSLNQSSSLHRREAHDCIAHAQWPCNLPFEEGRVTCLGVIRHRLTKQSNAEIAVFHGSVPWLCQAAAADICVQIASAV